MACTKGNRAITTFPREVCEMRLNELKAEIRQTAQVPYGAKLYPITSDWVPVTDVLSIVDRFERELRRQWESVLESARSRPNQNISELLQRIMTDLLS